MRQEIHMGLEEHITNPIETIHSYPLASDPVLNHNHPILIMVGGHGVQVNRDRD